MKKWAKASTVMKVTVKKTNNKALNKAQTTIEGSLSTTQQQTPRHHKVVNELDKPVHLSVED